MIAVHDVREHVTLDTGQHLEGVAALIRRLFAQSLLQLMATLQRGGRFFPQRRVVLDQHVDDVITERAHFVCAEFEIDRIAQWLPSLIVPSPDS